MYQRIHIMLIEGIRALTGPNVYNHHPVLVMRLDLEELTETPSSAIPGFTDRLLALLPGIEEHQCSRGYRGGFVERLREGTYPAHIVEHVAIELSQIAGIPVSFGKARWAGPGASIYNVIVRYSSEQGMRRLLETAVALVDALIGNRPFPLDERLKQVREIATATELDLGTRAVIAAAERRGIPWTRLDEKNLIQLGWGIHRRYLRGTMMDGSAVAGSMIVGNGGLLRRMLDRASIPVPRDIEVADEAEIPRALAGLGAPITVRPLGGANGMGITAAVHSEREAIAAFRVAREYARSAIFEEHFTGRSYRVLIVGYRVAAACERVPGGVEREVSDQIHASIASLCQRGAEAVGLAICGIDLVVENIAAPFRQGSGGIVGVDPAPRLEPYLRPAQGAPRDVGTAITDMLFPHHSNGRIPTVAITGTNGKTTVTRMIGHILCVVGKSVGMTTTDGIWLRGERIYRGDTTGPASAATILGSPRTEIAVLETARGGIVRRGLGFDWCDVAVMTTIQPDHIGQDGIEDVQDILHIKSLVAERVREGGTLILNVDDELLAELPESPAIRKVPKKIVCFSLDSESLVVERYRAEGGTVYFPRNGWIVEATASMESPIVEVTAIPATFGGRARFQIANAMAACGACRALGVSIEDCARGLVLFSNDANNPGRTNLYRVGSGYVLVDYGHNPDAMAEVCRMISHWRDQRLTGVIGVPGDRDDRVVMEAGRAVARSFDRIIVKEDHDLRGRQSGEIAEMLCRAVREVVPGCECQIVPEETEALERALAEMIEGEVIVIFYDKLDPILDVLARHGAVPAHAVEEKLGAPAAP